MQHVKSRLQSLNRNVSRVRDPEWFDLVKLSFIPMYSII